MDSSEHDADDKGKKSAGCSLLAAKYRYITNRLIHDRAPLLRRWQGCFPDSLRYVSLDRDSSQFSVVDRHLSSSTLPNSKQEQ